MRPKSISITELCRRTGAVLRRVRDEGVVVCITRHGRPAAVMLDCARAETHLAQHPSRTWPPDYFAQTYGALADDPGARPVQGAFEAREPLGLLAGIARGGYVLAVVVTSWPWSL